MKNSNFLLNDNVVKKTVFFVEISMLSYCKLKKLFELS